MDEVLDLVDVGLGCGVEGYRVAVRHFFPVVDKFSFSGDKKGRSEKTLLRSKKVKKWGDLGSGRVRATQTQSWYSPKVTLPRS